MTTQNTDAALAAVIPEIKTLTIAGEEVAIRQIKTGQLPAVLRAVQPLSHMLKQKGPFDLNGMFMLYTEDCLTLLQVLSGQSREWIDGLEIDDSIKLFSVLLEANLDFFVLRVLPLLPDAMAHLTGRLTQLTATIGPTASNPSSTPVTA